MGLLALDGIRQVLMTSRAAGVFFEAQVGESDEPVDAAGRACLVLSARMLAAPNARPATITLTSGVVPAVSIRVQMPQRACFRGVVFATGGRVRFVVPSDVVEEFGSDEMDLAAVEMPPLGHLDDPLAAGTVRVVIALCGRLLRCRERG